MQDISKELKKLKKVQYELAEIVREVEDKTRKSYREVPGVMGKFDGVNMITEEGETYEVPANYAAKSLLVYGDTLKRIEEDGKTIFKQIERVRRKKVEGVATKKDGKWYVLTESGSYRISPTAAEFQGISMNSKVIAVIPEDILEADFATLDRVFKDSKSKIPKEDKEHKEKEGDTKKEEETIILKEAKEESKDATEKKVEKKEEVKEDKPKRKAKPAKRTEKKKPERKSSSGVKEAGKKTEEIPQKHDEKESTQSILEEDDLR